MLRNSPWTQIKIGQNLASNFWSFSGKLVDIIRFILWENSYSCQALVLCCKIVHIFSHGLKWLFTGKFSKHQCEITIIGRVLKWLDNARGYLLKVGLINILYNSPYKIINPIVWHITFCSLYSYNFGRMKATETIVTVDYKQRHLVFRVQYWFKFIRVLIFLLLKSYRDYNLIYSSITGYTSSLHCHTWTHALRQVTK